MASVTVSAVVKDATGASTTATATAATSTGGYDNTAHWPDASNRPTVTTAGSTATLHWIGPTAGGVSTASDAAQSLVLTPASGDTFSTAGQIIEGKDFSGAVLLAANNITLRRCRISGVGGSGYVVGINWDLSGCVIEDCYVDGKLIQGSSGVVGGSTIRRCNVTGCENPTDPGPGPTLIVDNYFHNFVPYPGHPDGVQNFGGGNGNNSTDVEHNTIYLNQPATSCVGFMAEASNLTNPKCNNNVLCYDWSSVNPGGACIYLQEKSGYSITGAVITNNHLGPGRSGGGTTIYLVNSHPWTNSNNMLDGFAILDTLTL